MKLRGFALLLLIIGGALILAASLPALAVSGFLDQSTDSTHVWALRGVRSAY